MTTTFMDMTKPTVSSTLGPEWASEVNDCLDVIDAHDHADGKGTPVTPAGMDINAELDCQDEKLSNVASLSLFPKAAADATHLGSIQRIGTNLWWINASGAAVQLTNGSSVASAGTGVLTPSVVSSYPYTILTTDAQAVLIIDTASARTLTLPAASTAMMVGVKDGVGTASTNNITVTPDGTDLIDAVNANYLIQEDFGCKFFLSDGVSKWYVI